MDTKNKTATPLVTIVIPTFNESLYLPACIDHCIFQSYTEIEIIIVNGGSTDDTQEYLAKLANRIKNTTVSPVLFMNNNSEIVRANLAAYPQNRRIRIINFDRDIGATRTYNEGLKRASGKYCTYIVGDDLPHPHMIEEMVNVMEREPEIDFVYSDMNVVDDMGRIIRQIRLPDYDFEQCLARWFHLGVSKLYRTRLHDEAGLMDENFTVANDYDHYLRFAMAGCRFHHLPRILYSVRWHGPERKTGQHTESRYTTLLDESKKCAERARRWLRDPEKVSS